MRKKARERLEPQWEGLAADTLPGGYPNVSACVVRGPWLPTLMPTRLRFVRIDDPTGARPVSPELETAFTTWYNRTVHIDEDNDASAVAHLMARELKAGSTVVVGVAAGSCDRQLTHYTGWRPDHSWRTSSDWGTRLHLPFSEAGAAAYLRLLDEVGAWVSTVPDSLADYRSVLVGCPYDDLIAGRWWRYADGSRGSPMPVVDLGTPNDADEFFRVAGASEARSPVLRELETAKSHVFAVGDGPAGFLLYAEPDAVTRSSDFLDWLNEPELARQEATLLNEDWPDATAAIDRVRSVVPTLCRFYDRASQRDFCVIHFSYVDGVLPIPAIVNFPNGVRSN